MVFVLNRNTNAYELIRTNTYELNSSPSSIVSGRSLPLVSGRSNTNEPPRIADKPNMISGRGSQTSSRSKMRGDKIPPIRLDVEQIPTPTLLYIVK